MLRPTRRELQLVVILLTMGTLARATSALAAPTQQGAGASHIHMPIALARSPIAKRPGVRSGASWHTWRLTATSETLIGTVTLSPNTDRLDGVIALLPEGAATLERSAVQVRFNIQGEIDALDGADYRAVTRQRYGAGRIYELRIVVNVPRQTFDAYVTPANEAPVLIARDFAFSPTAASVDRIAQLAVHSTEGSIQVLDFGASTYADYKRVTPKTAYAWFPDKPDEESVINVSPTPGEGWYGTSDIHPEGTDMIFHGAAWGNARIWRYTFATRTITPLTPPTFVAVEPAYRVDGSAIVFTSDKGLSAPRFDMFEVGRTRPDEDGFKGGYTGAANLWVMDADGGNRRRLTTGDSHVDKRGSFSPDGKTVVFLSSRGANTLYMWTVPVDGSSPPTKVQLVDNPWVGRPRYSVDGKEIYFFSGVDKGSYEPRGRHTLCRVPVGSNAWRPLPNDTVGFGSHGPDPDPSGEHLWYHAFNNDLWGVFRLPLQGGRPTRFIPPGFRHLHIAHATEAANGTVAFDSRTYVESP